MGSMVKGFLSISQSKIIIIKIIIIIKLEKKYESKGKSSSQVKKQLALK